LGSKKKKEQKPKKVKRTYEVRRVATPPDVVMVSRYKDNFDELTTSMSRDEMIQLLMSGLTVPNSVVAWGVWDNANRLRGYLVALNTIYPPLSQGISIIYAHSTAPTSAQRKVLVEVETWAKELGANSIMIHTKHPGLLFAKFGFVDSHMVTMEKQI
jgi:hypothetical protein